MQSNRPPLQAGKLGLPSSPACTRLKRDAPFVEGHSRNQSQPISFTTTRSLRPHRAVHVSRVSTRSGPRTIGTTFDSRSKVPAGSRDSSTSAGSESSTSSFSFQGRMNNPQHGRYFSILENGDSIWNRVAAAASVLTVNVNKAWYSRILASDDEETAPGRDSHLIRVMKAYHLAKARHPSDLPDWLFDERERKPSLSSRFRESPRGAASHAQSLYPPALRHVYDDTASLAPRTNHSHTTSHVLTSPEKTGSSKAADRLKAFRDAKRADLGVRHVSSKSESSSCSPSRTYTNVDARHNDSQQGVLSSPTRRPVLSAQPSKPGAF
ncbi:uncharacterized protein BJ212DRAFT_1311724 [Suillus subaureus]|uniref:Mso1 N-terminal domain-containing protein n=1 Tax=Suillus subaureus TaxID=48587 RepID=A0A9P7JKD3_9AGAM|nr:uncharacterized protein BJ212DRAFT_1311724 [Suillus subaureus]KAG1827353.1 hypothetical protein BJ212DRAFT_1311724 [Suillus subaureus]